MFKTLCNNLDMLIFPAIVLVPLVIFVPLIVEIIKTLA